MAKVLEYIAKEEEDVSGDLEATLKDIGSACDGGKRPKGTLSKSKKFIFRGNLFLISVCRIKKKGRNRCFCVFIHI